MDPVLLILVIVLGLFAVVTMAIVGAKAAAGRVAAVTDAGDEAGTDLAPGWHIYCTSCRATKPMSKAGGVRIGGNRGAVKRTVARCTSCDRLRIAAISHESRLPADIKRAVHLASG